MKIILKKVRVHNLKGVDLELEPNQLVVFTGVSGSGKTSLAFDTIYIEGQRRYIESLSTFARRHLGDLPKPEAELISGISPTIAIEQKTAGRTPRSTVGTITGIYDYMRVLYARAGTAHCPITGEEVAPQSTVQIIHKIQEMGNGAKIIVLSPYAKGKKGEFVDDFALLLRRGFTRVRLDGKIIDLTEKISVDGKVAHDVDLVIDRIVLPDDARVKEAVSKALEEGKGVMSVLKDDEEILFSQHAYAFKSKMSYPPLEPHDFSFNHPSGMCPACQGLGVIREFDLEQIIDPNLSIAEDCCKVAPSYKTVRFGNIYDNLAKIYGFSVHTPWKDLPEKAKKPFLYGIDAKWTKMTFVHPVKKSRWIDYIRWRGVLFEAHQRYAEATSDVYRNNMNELMIESSCHECHGARIKPYPAATKLRGKKIGELTSMPASDCLEFFKKVKPTAISEELLKEIIQRFEFLMGVGLHYLTLDRTAPTLSGGEAQRVRLASQIGSGLVAATYVLDEPSIGLHPRDNARLLETLKVLRDKGNTVLVVEHDEETIMEADTVIDVGPLAGALGGEIVAQGSIDDLIASERSITGAYLSGRLSIPIPKKRRKSETFLKIKGASHHNLKNIDVSFPLGLFIAVTGVSGSGKSSLITDTLFPALSNRLQKSRLPIGKNKGLEGIEPIEKVIAIDQSAIGRTPRSNPATYVKLFDDIRDLFSKLPESVAFGYKPGRFSFNVKEGSCPHCEGMGMTKIDMDFMEDQWTVCVHCKGKRFDPKTLAILYRGKNIHDVLEMTVKEALEFFQAIPSIKQKLETLDRVGLGYIHIGQPSPTLSGGEAQRIKLAKELSRPSQGKTFYILDEPTTGLHFHDIAKLIEVLQSLVTLGNTVLVIEHNMDLVKTTDWIIDLGPEGGEAGGKLLSEGPPEKIAKLKTSTGIALSSKAEKKKKRVTSYPPIESIVVEGAGQNNLKMVDATLPRGKISLCTGPSGSGKTSFAFETIYAEGQRRYIESLSPYARQFVKQMAKPKVENIEGLSASIAIEQKSHAGNPRSTVGTMTEAYDFLRVLFAHLGTAYSPDTGQEIRSISKEYVVEKLLELPQNSRLQILSPLRKTDTFEELQRKGYLRIRLNGKYYELDQEIPYDKQRKNELFLVVDRLTVHEESRKRLFEAVDHAAALSGGTLIVDHEGKDLFFNLTFADPSTGKSYPPLTPHSFSFNTESGMCLDCEGLGFQFGTDLSRHKEIVGLSPLGLMRAFWKELVTQEAYDLFLSIMKKADIDPRKPLFRLPPEQLQLLFNGPIVYKNYTWRGINSVLVKTARGSSLLRDVLMPFLDQIPCLSCQGSRLNPLARHVKIGKLSIVDVCRLPVDSVVEFLSSLKVPVFLQETHTQLKSRAHFLQAIGLGYLALERSAPTLSGGETQRIRLSRQLGSGLTGCLYVLDEPTIGLHPHDNELLNDALKRLCGMGNTLILVEHDPLTIEIADYILDFGPGAGIHGGRITARGSLKEIKANPTSLTGAYLSGKKKVPIPAKRRSFKESFALKDCSLHNLKHIDVAFPLGLFTCITGVSGSGKSSLMELVIKKHRFEKLISIDQAPLGHTIRADVSTYVDLSQPLRALYSSMPVAKAKGLQPRHFSPNHKRGMCQTCFGLGVKTIYLQFLPPVKVTCDACRGFRLNPVSLEVTLKDKNYGQLLDMTVEEAKEFLIPVPKAIRILDTLISVGLGYLKLNQEIVTLSGGEQQRIRLSRELAKRAAVKTLYVLDEPTVGLHPDDIVKLLAIFHTLVDKGHTLIVVEHNLDVIANADYIIDLGPGAGAKGGEIVAQGTPETVAKNAKSLTGKYLMHYV